MCEIFCCAVDVGIQHVVVCCLDLSAHPQRWWLFSWEFCMPWFIEAYIRKRGMFQVCLSWGHQYFSIFYAFWFKFLRSVIEELKSCPCAWYGPGVLHLLMVFSIHMAETICWIPSGHSFLLSPFKTTRLGLHSSFLTSEYLCSSLLPS